MTFIDIGKDFSPYLGPRYRKLGSKSGQEFYEDILKPAFELGQEIVIDLDNIRGPTPSFFDEVFGSLVRDFGLETVQARVIIRAARNQHLLRQIETYMREASRD